MTARRVAFAAGSAIWLLIVTTLVLLNWRTLYGTFWFAVQLAARSLQ